MQNTVAIKRKDIRRYLNLEDFAKAAERFLPKALYAYVSGAAGAGIALSANRQAFQQWALIPRQLTGVSQRKSVSTLFDHAYSMPIGVSAFGAAAVVGYDSDIAMARAARIANVPYQLSANSITPMEEVINVNPEAWFAAYLPDNPEVIKGVLKRARVAGFKTLVITVDVPVAAFREAEVRAGYTMPFKPSIRLGLDIGCHPRWLYGRFLRTLIKRDIPHIKNIAPDRGPSIFASNVGQVGGAADFNWNTIRSIRAQWPGKLMLKGILHADDALTAEKAGVDGLIVSNHGGRLTDSVISPLEALPAIRQACPDLTVILDGGVRAGDALKAVALGADGVMIGRPFFYATILGGTSGLLHALQLVSDELDREMGFHGLLSPQEIRCGQRIFNRHFR